MHGVAPVPTAKLPAKAPPAIDPADPQPDTVNVVPDATTADGLMPRLVTAMPESVSVQVVEAVVQIRRSVVVGTVAKPFMVFVVVAPLCKIV